MKVPRNRNVDRLGVNTTHKFFEEWGCVFTEVPQQNDFGKDAYVDMGKAQQIGPFYVALQIKSGRSFRYKSGEKIGNYFIPVGRHADVWRRSTVPVFGIIYDPDDGLLRWVDITGYLRAHTEMRSGRINVLKSSVSSANTVEREFYSAVSAYSQQVSQDLIVRLTTRNGQQVSAVVDTWALAWSIPELLVLLRRLMVELDRDATKAAIFYLSLSTNHPDIYWHDKNRLPEDVRASARQSFRWSPEEIAHLFCAVDVDDYGRGSLGQCCEMLLMEDPAISKCLTRKGLSDFSGL